MSYFVHLMEDNKEQSVKSSRRSSVASHAFEYNPYQYPPIFELAEDHLLATRIARPIIKQGVVNIDEPTGLPVENVQVPICIGLYDMNFLSPGYPLYFQYVKFSIYMALCFLFGSGIYNLYTNYKGTSCVHPRDVPRPVTWEYVTTHCIYTKITSLSLGNKSNDKFEQDISELLNLITIVVVILLLQFFRKHQREVALVCDERIITSSDFTCRVRHLPTSFPPGTKVDDVIKEWFVDHGLPGHKLNVQRIHLCFDVSEKLELRKKADKLTLEKLSLQHELGTKRNMALEKKLMGLESQIEDIKRDIRELDKEFRSGNTNLFLGECYITLETQQELQAVLKFWAMDKKERQRLKKSKTDLEHKFDGHLLKIEQAVEPTDIYWENSGVTHRQRFVRRLITFVGTVLILIGSFFLIYEIKIGREVLVTWLRGRDENGELNGAAAAFFSRSASFGIIFVNLVLEFAFEHFTHFERYTTYSERESHYAMKLSIAEFFNTSITTLIISLHARNMWGLGGLTTSIYYIFVNDAVIPVIVGAIDIGFWLRALKRTWMRLRKNHVNKLQKDLDDDFEYPKFNFAAKYSYYNKTLWSAAFYAPLVPTILVWVVIGFLLRYWLDKVFINSDSLNYQWHMFRHRARGPSIGAELSIQFMDFFEYAIFLFAAGNLFFMVFVLGVDPGRLAMTIIGFVLCLIQAILPTRKISEDMFPLRDEITTDDKYSTNRINFLEDYDRANPATSELAIDIFARERQGQTPMLLSSIKRPYNPKEKSQRAFLF